MSATVDCTLPVPLLISSLLCCNSCCQQLLAVKHPLNLTEQTVKTNVILLIGLRTLCFKTVEKLREVFNVRVAARHRLAQAQEEPAGWGSFSRFCLRSQNFFLQNRVKILEF